MKAIPAERVFRPQTHRRAMGRRPVFGRAGNFPRRARGGEREAAGRWVLRGGGSFMRETKEGRAVLDAAHGARVAGAFPSPCIQNASRSSRAFCLPSRFSSCPSRSPSCMKIRIKALRASLAPRSSLSRRRGRGSQTPSRPGQGRHARQGALKMRSESFDVLLAEARRARQEKPRARREPSPRSPCRLRRTFSRCEKQRLRGTPTRRSRPAPFSAARVSERSEASNVAGFSPWGSSRA